jgi:predicted lipoprotein with Yx(FWY)xxD motif
MGASSEATMINSGRFNVRRILIAIAAVGALVLALAGMATAGGSRAKLQLRQTSVGRILVNSRGFTVYAFTKDSRNHDACVKINGCVGAWRMVTTSGAPIAGAGVKSSLIGTIKPKPGVVQVTYAGHPLYTYTGDTGPGQTFYVNVLQFGGRWPALNTAGNEVK